MEHGFLLGLADKSGCDTSTFARIIVGLIHPSGQAIGWEVPTLAAQSADARQLHRQGMKMMFGIRISLNPLRCIRSILRETVGARGTPTSEADDSINRLLALVSLDA